MIELYSILFFLRTFCVVSIYFCCKEFFFGSILMHKCEYHVFFHFVDMLPPSQVTQFCSHYKMRIALQRIFHATQKQGKRIILTAKYQILVLFSEITERT